MMHNRGRWLPRIIVMTCVAVVTLSGCGDIPQSDDSSSPTIIIKESETPSHSPSPVAPSATSSPTSRPYEVNADRSIPPPMIYREDEDVVTCDDSSDLLDVKFNETTVQHGITVVSRLEGGKLTISLSPANAAVQGGVVNDYIPFQMPRIKPGDATTTIVVNSATIGEFSTVILCKVREQ